MTYEKIALLLNVSPARVWQIEQRALTKLRRELKRKGITADELRAIPPEPGETFKVSGCHSVGD